MPSDGNATSAMVAASAAPPEAPITKIGERVTQKTLVQHARNGQRRAVRAAPITRQTNLDDDPSGRRPTT
jgi:hypothetical protein